MKLQTIFTLLLILAAILLAIFSYQQLPSIVPSHWNALGEVDGYVSKNGHIVMFLGLCIGLPLLMTLIPKIDPKYTNIQKFEGNYSWFVVVMTAFTIGMFIYTTMYSLGYKFPIQNYMIPALSVLFFSVSNLLKKAKSNYTIGIRVPWTLHSEKNWDLTHQLAAKSFAYGSIVLLLTLLLGQNTFAVFMTFLFVMVLVPIIYSYWLHTQRV